MTDAHGPDDLGRRCVREVAELHRFFEAWFNADLPADDEAFSRFEAAMAPGFVIIDPGGRLRRLERLTESLRSNHGCRSGADDFIRIAVEAARVRHRLGDLCLVTYEEWQETPDRTVGRLSSALFRRRRGAPNGVQWVHVHETSLAAEERGESQGKPSRG